MDIKICGLKTDEAVSAALDGGASHIGFIFFAKSPRNIDPAEAGRLREAARGRALAVAVTVDAVDGDLDGIVSVMRPDMLQLHGTESPGRVTAVRERYNLPVMKALSINSAADLDKITHYADVADRLLFDAKPPAGSLLPGGNGVSFDWTLLTGLSPKVDFFLSGGINAGNVADALRRVAPAGLDVSSGVEQSPGVKDPALIAEFFRALRRAQAQTAA